MQSTDDDSIAVAIEDRYREALVAARVVKRAKAHQSDMTDQEWKILNQVLNLSLHVVRAARDTSHRSEILGQHRRHAPGIDSLEDAVEPPLKSPLASGDYEQPCGQEYSHHQEEYPKPKVVVV